MSSKAYTFDDAWCQVIILNKVAWHHFYPNKHENKLVSPPESLKYSWIVRNKMNLMIHEFFKEFWIDLCQKRHNFQHTCPNLSNAIQILSYQSKIWFFDFSCLQCRNLHNWEFIYIYRFGLARTIQMLLKNSSNIIFKKVMDQRHLDTLIRRVHLFL